MEDVRTTELHVVEGTLRHEFHRSRLKANCVAWNPVHHDLFAYSPQKDHVVLKRKGQTYPCWKSSINSMARAFFFVAPNSYTIKHLVWSPDGDVLYSQQLYLADVEDFTLIQGTSTSENGYTMVFTCFSQGFPPACSFVRIYIFYYTLLEVYHSFHAGWDHELEKLNSKFNHGDAEFVRFGEELLGALYLGLDSKAVMCETTAFVQIMENILASARKPNPRDFFVNLANSIYSPERSSIPQPSVDPREEWAARLVDANLTANTLIFAQSTVLSKKFNAHKVDWIHEIARGTDLVFGREGMKLLKISRPGERDELRICAIQKGRRAIFSSKIWKGEEKPSKPDVVIEFGKENMDITTRSDAADEPTLILGIDMFVPTEKGAVVSVEIGPRVGTVSERRLCHLDFDAGRLTTYSSQRLDESTETLAACTKGCGNCLLIADQGHRFCVTELPTKIPEVAEPVDEPM
ncbi:unnamed protein product, partial [Mesorhabditis spiculigera]